MGLEIKIGWHQMTIMTKRNTLALRQLRAEAEDCDPKGKWKKR